MRGLKKVISGLIGTYMIIANFSTVSAKHYYLEEMSSVENTSQVKYNNIEIGQLDDTNVLVVKDLQKPGEIIYKMSSIESIEIETNYKVPPIVYRDKKENKYVLGLSEDASQYKLKYLSDDEEYGNLKNRYYIYTKNNNWYELTSVDDGYLFKKLDVDLEEQLDLFKENLVDFGINIYGSCDGINFKKLAFKQKFSQYELNDDDDDIPSTGTSMILQNITLQNSRNYKYLKISINDISSLNTESGDSDVFDSSTVSIVNLKLALAGDHVYGVSDENSDENVGNDEDVSDSRSNRRQTRKNRTNIGHSFVLGDSSDTEDMEQNRLKLKTKSSELSIGSSQHVVVKASDNSKSSKQPRKSWRPWRSNYDNDYYWRGKRNNLASSSPNKSLTFPKSSKKSGATDSSGYKSYLDDDFISPKQDKFAFVSDGPEDNSDDFDNQSTEDKEAKLKKRAKQFSSSTFNKYGAQNILEKEENTDVNNNQLKNNEEAEIRALYVRNQEISKQEDKQEQAEKTVSKLYLSGLCLALGAVFGHDKIGFIMRRFIKI